MYSSQFPSAAGGGLAELKALSKIIQESIDKIEATLSAEKMSFPSSATPFTFESETTRNLPPISDATENIVSAAYQLIQASRSPRMTMLVSALQYMVTVCVGVAIRANAAECCREAGPEGAHVSKIAATSNIDPSKLARVLRVLASHHIFIEVLPDVFANNRLSSVLDTGKRVEELVADPSKKHVDTTGIPAVLSHNCEDGLKAGSYIIDALFHPAFAQSEEVNETSFNLAFNTKQPIWEWFEQPGNEQRLLRFGMAMKGLEEMSPPGSLLEGFDWGAVPKDSVVVDVGGGIGSVSMAIFKAYSHLRIVVQDRETVIESAHQYWESQTPEAYKSGRIILQAHDFFKPQPVHNADIFILRMVMHDWSDKHCLEIFRRLREAAMPTTRLLVLDEILSYACPVDDNMGTPGTGPPPPLLSNLGHANAYAYFSDLLMLNLVNAKERTLVQTRDLLARAGWEIVHAHHRGTQTISITTVEAVPV